MLLQPLVQHMAESVSEVLQDLSFLAAAQRQWVPPEGAQRLAGAGVPYRVRAGLAGWLTCPHLPAPVRLEPGRTF